MTLREPFVITGAMPNLLSTSASDAPFDCSIRQHHVRAPFTALDNGRSRPSNPHR
jgi:hypothetical protein